MTLLFVSHECNRVRNKGTEVTRHQWFIMNTEFTFHCSITADTSTIYTAWTNQNIRRNEKTNQHNQLSNSCKKEMNFNEGHCEINQPTAHYKYMNHVLIATKLI